MKVQVQINKEAIIKNINGLKEIVVNYSSAVKLLKAIRSSGLEGLEKQVDHEIEKYEKLNK